MDMWRGTPSHPLVLLGPRALIILRIVSCEGLIEEGQSGALDSKGGTPLPLSKGYIEKQCSYFYF